MVLNCFTLVKGSNGQSLQKQFLHQFIRHLRNNNELSAHSAEMTIPPAAVPVAVPTPAVQSARRRRGAPPTPPTAGPGPRLHLPVPGNPNDTSTAASRPAPELRDHLADPPRRAPPAEVRPLARQPGGTSFLRAGCPSPPPDRLRGGLRRAEASDVAGPGQPGCWAWAAPRGPRQAGLARRGPVPGRTRALPGRRAPARGSLGSSRGPGGGRLTCAAGAGRGERCARARPARGVAAPATLRSAAGGLSALARSLPVA